MSLNNTAAPEYVRTASSVLVGRTEVPVEVTLFGDTGPDVRDPYKPRTVANVESAGHHDREHHVVNGVPVRFWAHVEVTGQGTYRIAHLSAYRGDKDFGLAEVTDTVRSALYRSIPGLVSALLADDKAAHDAQVALARRTVARCEAEARRAQEALEEANAATLAAEEALATLLEGSQ